MLAYDFNSSSQDTQAVGLQVQVEYCYQVQPNLKTTAKTETTNKLMNELQGPKHKK